MKFGKRFNPSFVLTNYTRAALLGLVLSLSLVYMLFVFSKSCNSLLLFNVGLVQTGIAVSLFTTLLTSLSKTRLASLRLGFIFSLISGFILSLSTGYTFIETYTRLNEPVSIKSYDALLAAITVLAGNIFLIRLLFKIGMIKIKTGSVRLAFSNVLLISVIVCLASALMHITGLYVIDTIIGMIIGLPLLFVTAFIMLDAYWKLTELL